MPARMKRHINDTKQILQFMDAKNPFTGDLSLRSIATGVTVEERTNFDEAREVGQKILTDMTGKESDEYVFKKANLAIVISTHNVTKATNMETQVDPQLLFQRFVAFKDFVGQDARSLFQYELCTVPASLFDTSGLPRMANKPVLAEAIAKLSIQVKRVRRSHFNMSLTEGLFCNV